MNEDREVNSDDSFLDNETIHAAEHEEIVDPRVFFALSNDLLVIAGADGYFHRLNQTWEKTTGYTIEELRSRPFLEFVHPDDRERTLDTAKRNFSGGEIKGFENRYICKDGSIRWFLWNSVPSKQANLSYAVAHDITDRKKVESELLDLSKALANAVEGIAQVDANAEFISTNKSFSQQLGYELGELVGVHWQNIVVPASLEALQNAYNQMIESGKAHFECQGLRKNNTTFYAEVTIISTFDDKQQFSGHHCFMKDISERKQAELSLEHSEARFRSLSAQLPGIVYQFVITTGGYRHFPYISESCTTITGYEPFEIQQNPNLALAMVHPDDLPELRARIYESINDRMPYSFEGRIITKSGELKWIQASTSPEVLNTNDVLWNSIVTDISALKTAEEKIKQLNDDLARRVNRLSDVNHELGLLTEKLELAYDQALEASKLKSEFVANISHEVRTPLSAVIGMTDLLLDTRLTEEQRDLARIVKDSAQSLLAIINDILDFSKMEAGKMELDVVDFDLLALVEGCVELLASSAREKGLALITFLDPKTPRMMRGDPVRLRQVLLNLISNAIKFTEEGKVIIKVFSEPAVNGTKQLLFSVEDTGVGLTSETKKMLFQPFVQADGSTTRKYGGTGLGLSISKRIVELMGGSIGVESESGSGATFFFSVNLSEAAESKTILDNISASKLTGKRCLIIDENGSLNYAVQPYLRAISLETMIVAEAQKAVFQLKSALLQGKPFNLLIIDFDRKKVEINRSIFESIAASARDSRTPVIYLINFDEKEKVLKTLKSSFACSFLTKPIRQMAFYQHVADILTQNQHTAEDWDEAHLTGVLEFAAPFTKSTHQAKTDTLLHGVKSRFAEQPSFDASPSSGESVLRQIRLESPAIAFTPVSEPESTDERKNSRRILLAEDNPIMQKLAMQQLNKLGLTVTAVSNGKEALDALESQDYLLVLMDCQMPVLDGFATTRIIRTQEKTTGKHLPVIALTASAMQGDEDICYAAGMDDYLCKPVDRHQLKSIINKWSPQDELLFLDTSTSSGDETLDADAGGTGSGEGGAAEGASTVGEGERETEQTRDKEITESNSENVHNGSQIFNLPELISLYGKSSIPELLLSFIEEGNAILLAAKKAIEEKDVQELKMQAHTFKGMAAVLTAANLARISLKIEDAAKKADFETADRHFNELTTAFSSAENAIRKILKGNEQLA
jgi:PAS domain S-box-containing protein